MKEYEFLRITFVQNVWMRESHTYNEYNAWGPRKFEGFENSFFSRNKINFSRIFHLVIYHLFYQCNANGFIINEKLVVDNWFGLAKAGLYIDYRRSFTYFWPWEGGVACYCQMKLKLYWRSSKHIRVSWIFQIKL